MQHAFHTGCNPLFKFFYFLFFIFYFLFFIFLFFYFFIFLFGFFFDRVKFGQTEDIQPVMGKAANLCEHATRIVI